MKKTHNRGGKRLGAGPKPIRGERKQSLTIGVTPVLREFLDSQPGSISEAVEEWIRRTEEFISWLEAR